jgi:hypothetical protein
MTEQPPPDQPRPGEPAPPPFQQSHPTQPGQAGYAPYPYPPYPHSPPINTYAILSLVLGAAVFPPLGIYFGRKAKTQIAQTGERGAELATAGIVVGWVLTAFFGVLLLVWCGLVGTAILLQ